MIPEQTAGITYILSNGCIGVKCNACYKWHKIKNPHKNSGQKARQAAKESGWTITRKKALCPKHTENQ